MQQPTRTASATQSEQKHRMIIAAAAEVFMRLGYGSASMEAIAAEAKVSKQTVYNHFLSKEELFKAIIADITGTLMEPLSLRDADDVSPRQRLQAFAADFFALMLEPRSLALYRLIISESARFPELGASIYNAGAGKLIEVLADYLTRESRLGTLTIPDPERAAEQFVGMLSGRVQLRALLGVSKRPSPQEINSRIEHSVSAFLGQYGAK